MAAHLILEVISGPMDGLKATISGKQAGIGRGVGNTLALPLDMHVSRPHASIVLEGHYWCLRETGGKTGTWLAGKKLMPGVSYPLSTGHVILMGTTIIHVRVVTEPEPDIFLSDDCFTNPMLQYDFAADLSEVWNTLTKDSSRKYIGVEDIFKAASALIPEIRHYACISGICSDTNVKCLGQWLPECLPGTPGYRLDKDTLLVTPRLLAILEQAGQRKTRSIGLKTFIEAVIEEGQSIASRYIGKDTDFIQRYPSLISGRHKPEAENPMPDAPVEDIQTMQDKAEPVTLSDVETETIDLVPDRADRLLEGLCAFETLVLGFLKDAAGHRTSNRNFFLPGHSRKLTALYADGGLKDVDAYMDHLYRILVGILAAQRDAAREVEIELHNRIKTRLNGFSGKKTNRIFKKPPVDEVSEKVLSILKEAELEQLADSIIRTKIKHLLDPPYPAIPTDQPIEHNPVKECAP